MELYSTVDICRRVAEAARAARLRQDLWLATLATRAGVSQASLIRFKRTGEISLKSLVNLAMALEAEAEFFRLFAMPDVPTIDELVAARKKRMRGRK